MAYLHYVGRFFSKGYAMKQYRYILNEELTLEGMIEEIQGLPEYVQGEKGLLQIVE